MQHAACRSGLVRRHWWRQQHMCARVGQVENRVEDMLETSMRYMVGMLGAAQYGRLAQVVEYWAKNPLSFATGCTGSDVGSLVLAKWAKVLATEFGHAASGLKIHYRFSCEINATKRRFAEDMVDAIPDFPKPAHIFENIERLHFEQNVCVRSGNMVNTPRNVDFFSAGFECDTVSKMNTKSSTRESSTCITTRTGAAGTTWGGTIAYVKEVLPLLVCLENVRNLGHLGGLLGSRSCSCVRGVRAVCGSAASARDLKPRCIVSPFATCVTLGQPDERARKRPRKTMAVAGVDTGDTGGLDDNLQTCVRGWLKQLM